MFKRAITLAFCSLLLAGCQSDGIAGDPLNPSAATLTPAQKQQQVQDRATFEALTINVLRSAGYRANTNDLDGSFNLLIKLDEKSQVIGCETQPNKQFDRKIYPYNPHLANDLLSICWTSVLPRLPSSLIDPKETTSDIVAPVAVFPLNGLSPQDRSARALMLQDQAQNDFLFKQLFAAQPIDSIGIATLLVMSDSSGHVKECAASLDPHVLRPSEFKQDDALLGGLISRCKQLDLNAMPGFTPNAQGMTSVFKRIEYTPWKAGLRRS